jgi:hypothetical protein
MAKALGWPLAIVCIVLLLRKRISAAIDRLRAVKHGDTEVSFEQEIGEAKVAAETWGLTVYQPSSGFKPSIIALTNEHPLAAMVEGWSSVEVALRDLAKKNDIPWRGVADSLKKLDAADLLGKGTVEIARYLNDIRNRAVHGFDTPTEGEALEFLMLSKSVAQRVTQAR